MKVRDLIEKLDFTLISGTNALDKNISGLYCCDLLSWVMSHAKEGNAWITVQTHINIVAVASLLDLGCIIIPESIEIDEDTKIKAIEEDIAILSTDLDSYQIFCKMYALGIK
ncbi:MAG: AraC family transcriptional regulator [Bacillota bacterium]